MKQPSVFESLRRHMVVINIIFVTVMAAEAVCASGRGGGFWLNTAADGEILALQKR
jgi:hypothetical protein